MIQVTTGTTLKFTGERVQIEIEQSEDKVNFYVRSNEVAHDKWRTIFSDSLSLDEVVELNQGINAFIKKVL